LDVKSKYRHWTEEDLDALKALIASGASALRASVALKRSRSMIKLKARDLGSPRRPNCERTVGSFSRILLMGRV
jgi:hypothetical protein